MGLDLNPRVVLRTQYGAVVIEVKPENLESGTVNFPAPLGAVPYSIVYDFPVSTIILHFPGYGPTSLPVSLTAMGSSGDQVVDLPLLGPTPYEVVLGPPNIPPEQIFSTQGALTAAFGGTGMWLLVGGGLLALLMLRR